MTTLMSAALPASATAHSHPAAETGCGLPSGLTEVDAARITTAIAAARTESTRHVYALVWSQWERWCTVRGVPALPGDPLALCAYLTERAVAGRAMDTLDTRITAHSLCASHATTAALAGVRLHCIAAQTRHKDISVLVNRYIRPLEALATTSSRDLGL